MSDGSSESDRGPDIGDYSDISEEDDVGIDLDASSDESGSDEGMNDGLDGLSPVRSRRNIHRALDDSGSESSSEAGHSEKEGGSSLAPGLDEDSGTDGHALDDSDDESEPRPLDDSDRDDEVHLSGSEKSDRNKPGAVRGGDDADSDPSRGAASSDATDSRFPDRVLVDVSNNGLRFTIGSIGGNSFVIDRSLSLRHLYRDMERYCNHPDNVTAFDEAGIPVSDHCLLADFRMGWSMKLETHNCRFVSRESEILQIKEEGRRRKSEERGRRRRSGRSSDHQAALETVASSSGAMSLPAVPVVPLDIYDRGEGGLEFHPGEIVLPRSEPISGLFAALSPFYDHPVRRSLVDSRTKEPIPETTTVGEWAPAWTLMFNNTLIPIRHARKGGSLKSSSLLHSISVPGRVSKFNVFGSKSKEGRADVALSSSASERITDLDKELEALEAAGKKDPVRISEIKEMIARLRVEDPTTPSPERKRGLPLIVFRSDVTEEPEDILMGYVQGSDPLVTFPFDRADHVSSFVRRVRNAYKVESSVKIFEERIDPIDPISEEKPLREFDVVGWALYVDESRIPMSWGNAKQWAVLAKDLKRAEKERQKLKDKERKAIEKEGMKQLMQDLKKRRDYCEARLVSLQTRVAELLKRKQVAIEEAALWTAAPSEKSGKIIYMNQSSNVRSKEFPSALLFFQQVDEGLKQVFRDLADLAAGHAPIENAESMQVKDWLSSMGLEGLTEILVAHDIKVTDDVAWRIVDRKSLEEMGVTDEKKMERLLREADRLRIVEELRKKEEEKDSARYRRELVRETERANSFDKKYEKEIQTVRVSFRLRDQALVDRELQQSEKKRRKEARERMRERESAPTPRRHHDRDHRRAERSTDGDGHRSRHRGSTDRRERGKLKEKDGEKDKDEADDEGLQRSHRERPSGPLSVDSGNKALLTSRGIGVLQDIAHRRRIDLGDTRDELEFLRQLRKHDEGVKRSSVTSESAKDARERILRKFLGEKSSLREEVVPMDERERLRSEITGFSTSLKEVPEDKIEELEDRLGTLFVPTADLLTKSIVDCNEFSSLLDSSTLRSFLEDNEGVNHERSKRSYSDRKSRHRSERR